MLKLLFLLVCAIHLSAHEGSVGWLSISDTTQGTRGRWHVAVKDISLELDLDLNRNDQITWGELRSRFPEIRALLQPALSFQSGGDRVEPHFDEFLVDHRAGSAYLVLEFALRPEPDWIHYRFFFESDLSHRLFVNAFGRSHVLTARNPSVQLTSHSRLTMLKHGAWHIWSGLDHILFLAVLILPVMLRGTESSKTRVISIIRIVTAFTIAHSITLALAVLGLVLLPASLVEPVIAISVLLAALNNLKPLWNDHAWPVAFIFGLFHGFGFAGPLLETGVAGGSMLATLALFNVGVELGQLVIVGLLSPALLLVSRSQALSIPVLRVGSCLSAGAGAIWFVERVF